MPATPEQVLTLPETLQCTVCFYSFLTELPYYHCTHTLPDGVPRDSMIICQQCFEQWLHGDIGQDNKGFVNNLRCRCGQYLSTDTIKEVIREDQFVKFEQAITAQALERMNDIIYCPGPDCPNIYIQSDTRKRGCRAGECESCGTEVCIKCGEKYTKQHQKMSCEAYKKWQLKHDEDMVALEKWKKTEQIEIKQCPGCSRDIQKNSGCSQMTCTNCRFNFCWRCLHLYSQCSCH